MWIYILYGKAAYVLLMQGMSKEGENLTGEVGFEYYYTASNNW